MKKEIKFILLFISLFFITMNVSASTYFVTGDGVRVRSTPKNEDNIVGKLNYGDVVDVVSLENSWYKIKFENGYGYITSRYVSVIEEGYKSNTIALLKAKTNLKKSNSTSSKTVTSIPKSAVVKVLSEKSGWSFVEYNESFGYVKTSSLKKSTKTNEFAYGTYTINFSLNNKARNNNISKSMKKLNNVVIKNGGKFSFINIVGKTGYSKAPEINKKTTVLGGGLSEVATSLYLALRDTQRNGCYINITEQNRYSSKTPYAKLGEEAVIDLKNNKDLVFVNKSGKNIKIYSNVSGNNVSFVIAAY